MLKPRVARIDTVLSKISLASVAPIYVAHCQTVAVVIIQDVNKLTPLYINVMPWNPYTCGDCIFRTFETKILSHHLAIQQDSVEWTCSV